MSVTDKNIGHQPYVIVRDDLQSRGNEITIQTGIAAGGDIRTLFSVINRRVLDNGQTDDYLAQIDITQKQLKTLIRALTRQANLSMSDIVNGVK